MARDSFFPFLGIAGVSPEYRRKYVSCLALCCLVAAAAATAAGSAGPAAAVAAAYLPTTELRAPQGHTQQSSLAGRSGWQQPCVLEANGQRSPCRLLFGVYPSLHLYLWLVASL